MTKAQMIQSVSDVMSVKKSEAEKIVEVVEAAIVDGLKEDGEVVFAGGKFKVVKTSARAERVGVNPKKPSEKIVIAAKPEGQKVVFKPGAKLKEKFV